MDERHETNESNQVERHQADDPDFAKPAESWDEPLLADDLEQAYLRALEATAAIEREISSQSFQPGETHATADGVANVAASQSGGPAEPVGETDAGDTGLASGAGPASTRALSNSGFTASSEPERVSEKQVVEAALFVGGMPLTAKRLGSLFHTEHGFGFVECLIDELNRQYADEERPYSITLGEGGYRLTLLPEFESVRNKAYGYGPKDVKLGQDVLEVLSLVAYRQPITKSQVEALGRSNSGPVLRQLLQRELIRIDREHSANDKQQKSDPPYVTTPRFLSLFGLNSLSDLPVAEDIEFK